MKHSFRYTKKVVKKNTHKVEILREYYKFICSIYDVKEYLEYTDITKHSYGCKGWHIGYKENNTNYTAVRVFGFKWLGEMKEITIENLPKTFKYEYNKKIFSTELYNKFKKLHKRKAILKGLRRV